MSRSHILYQVNTIDGTTWVYECIDCKRHWPRTTSVFQMDCTGPVAVQGTLPGMSVTITGWSPPPEAPPEAPVVDSSRCFECKAEMSSTLDAYHGRSWYLAALCINCRDNSARRAARAGAEETEAEDGY